MDFSRFSLGVSDAAELTNGDFVSRRSAFSVSLPENPFENWTVSLLLSRESIESSSSEQEDSSVERVCHRLIHDVQVTPTRATENPKIGGDLISCDRHSLTSISHRLLTP